MTRIAYIGNTVVPWCTEVHLGRGFNEHDVDVVHFDQNKTAAMGPVEFVGQVLDLDPRPDLVLYTRTHSRTALGPSWTADGWHALHDAGIKTASFHLDRFWDLNREKLIHQHDPLFTTQYVFTADGGNDDRFADARVNHHWLPPGVDRRECEEMPGLAQQSFPYDIVFVGSGAETYHDIYPQRGDLIRHLRDTYGGRFGHFGHGGDHPVVRGQELNDVYASAKIVVGDSCFANGTTNRADFYWSDRIPETLGRGGMLLHPFVNGVRACHPALATYVPGDWDDLDAQIGAYLANPGECEGAIARNRRDVLAVKDGHTYGHRAGQILQIVGLADHALMG